MIDKLAKLKCDPIEGMARIAMDKDNAPKLRGRMFSELAQYTTPKRKAIELSMDDDDGKLEIAWISGDG